MTSEWVAIDVLAGRHEPDATVAPQGRIEPGVVLMELDRLGAWVYVEMPDGSRWWVDGRRLDRPIDPPAGQLPQLESTREPEGHTGIAFRRKPLIPAAVGVVAVFVVIGGAALLFGGGDAPPTIVLGYADLGFEPLVVNTSEGDNFALVVAGGDTVATIDFTDEGEGALHSTEYVVDEPARAIVGDFGPPTVLSASKITVYGYGGVLRTFALPTGCCADVIANLGDGVVVFPERGGESREIVKISLDDGARESYTLPAAIEVTSVAEFDGYLYVGHTDGIMVLALRPGRCEEPLANWDIPTHALTVAMDDPPTIAGLNRDGSIFTIDPLGPFADVSGCGVERIPQLSGGVPLREAGLANRELQETLALVGDAAYVVDTDGVVYVVDLDRPNDDRDDRLITTIEIPGFQPSTGANVVRLDSSSYEQSSVFVTDPDRGRLWWIGSSGGGSTFDEITVLRWNP